jgi:hypothetical protein
MAPGYSDELIDIDPIDDEEDYDQEVDARFQDSLSTLVEDAVDEVDEEDLDFDSESETKYRNREVIERIIRDPSIIEFVKNTILDMELVVDETDGIMRLDPSEVELLVLNFLRAQGHLNQEQVEYESEMIFDVDDNGLLQSVAVI